MQGDRQHDQRQTQQRQHAGLGDDHHAALAIVGHLRQRLIGPLGVGRRTLGIRKDRLVRAAAARQLRLVRLFTAVSGRLVRAFALVTASGRGLRTGLVRFTRLIRLVRAFTVVTASVRVLRTRPGGRIVFVSSGGAVRGRFARNTGRRRASAGSAPS